MKIFIAISGLNAAQRTRLNTALCGHILTFSEEVGPASQRSAAVAEAEVVFGNIPYAWLGAASRLRWMQLDSAGVNAYLDLNSARTGPPVILTNLSAFYERAVAEAALGGILAFYRQLPRLFVAQSERRWIKTEVEPDIGQLHRARIVILGAGAIGHKLSTMLRSFECEVRLFARRAAAAQLQALAELDAALAATDVLINTLPETPATVGILDRVRLARLPATALVVNVGRGSAIDEAALLDALDNRRLGGAVLDVTATEPLPSDHPFWTHPRVILTQHTGGRFPGETDGKVTRFLENFAQYLRGAPLTGTVDLSRGY